MSNIKDVVFAVWRELEGGFIPDDTRFTYKHIRTIIVSCVGELALDLSMKLRNANPDNPYPEYYNQYDSKIEFDAKTGVNYANIQGKPISFNGVRSFDITDSVDSFHAKSVDYLPTTPQEWFNLKRLPRVPNVIHYMVGTNRVVFMTALVDPGSVTIQQGFSVPTAGDENSDIGVNIPDEMGASVISRSLMLLREELRPTDRANDGVPSP